MQRFAIESNTFDAVPAGDEIGCSLDAMPNGSIQNPATTRSAFSCGLGVEGELAGEIVHDLPGGEWRRVQRAKGYRAIMVNGEITFDQGQPTGATPGKLLRHGRA